MKKIIMVMMPFIMIGCATVKTEIVIDATPGQYGKCL
tara:strand:+ start:408 stop:518 length:111 start_codon:yes stop_codon:yes gene_type:complete